MWLFWEADYELRTNSLKIRVRVNETLKKKLKMCHEYGEMAISTL